MGEEACGSVSGACACVCVQVHVHFAKTRAGHQHLPLSVSTFFLWTGFSPEPGSRLATSNPQGHLSLSPTALASRQPCLAFCIGARN